MPACCDPNGSWDQSCVSAAEELSGPCAGVCATPEIDSCSHDVCENGEALDATCSSCVASVCDKDAFCCEDEWDNICANEAEADPYCLCSP